MIDKVRIESLIKKYEMFLSFCKVFRNEDNVEDIVYQQFLLGKICIYEIVIEDLKELLEEDKK